MASTRMIVETAIRRSDGPLYRCRHPWPTGSSLACGDLGSTFGNRHLYKVAFFEAKLAAIGGWPTTARGEATEITAAEDAAFLQMISFLACNFHEFAPSSLENGTGICVHCGQLTPGVIRSTNTCLVCGRPTWFMQSPLLSIWYCEAHAPEPPTKLGPTGTVLD